MTDAVAPGAVREGLPTVSGPAVRWRRTLLCAALGAAAFSASRLLPPTTVETLYSRGVGPIIARTLSRVTGTVPFSVVELLLVGYSVWVVALSVRAIRSVARAERRPVDVGAAGLLLAIRHGGAFVFLLYVLWGFNYARPPLEERIGWPAWSGADEAELIGLAETAVALTNRAYLELHDTEDVGVPTALPGETEGLEAALDLAWAEAADALDLPSAVAARYGRAKVPLLSPMLARLSIHGVYSPFTGEANVTGGLPAVRVPLSMAHEKAHQRGVASEAEANFLAFVVAASSDDRLARYAAAVFAQGQLIAALPGREGRRVVATRLPGVERDLRDLDDYLRRHRTAASAVQSAVNDRYLRANRVPGGIRNYGYSVRLLILYSRTYPDGLLASPDRGDDAAGG